MPTECSRRQLQRPVEIPFSSPPSWILTDDAGELPHPASSRSSQAALGLCRCVSHDLSSSAHSAFALAFQERKEFLHFVRDRAVACPERKWSLTATYFFRSRKSILWAWRTMEMSSLLNPARSRPILLIIGIVCLSQPAAIMNGGMSRGDTKSSADHGQSTDGAKVMDNCVARDDRIRFHMDVTTKQYAVDQHGIVHDVAVMGDVCVGHQQDPISDPSNAVFLGGPAIDSHTFSELIVVTDDDACCPVRRVRLVLRFRADDAAGPESIAIADHRLTGDDNVAVETALVSEHNIRANQAKRPDSNVTSNLCRRINLGEG